MNEQEREILAESTYLTAYQQDFGYKGCPQAVLGAIRENTGIVSEQLIALSQELAAEDGGAGLVGTCGALSGGLMALSTHFEKRPPAERVIGMRRCKELIARFRETFGGITCNTVQKESTGRQWTLGDPDEYQRFQQQSNRVCNHATGSVAKWVIELM